MVAVVGQQFGPYKCPVSSKHQSRSIIEWNPIPWLIILALLLLSFFIFLMHGEMLSWQAHLLEEKQRGTMGVWVCSWRLQRNTEETKDSLKRKEISSSASMHCRIERQYLINCLHRRTYENIPAIKVSEVPSAEEHLQNKAASSEMSW